MRNAAWPLQATYSTYAGTQEEQSCWYEEGVLGMQQPLTCAECYNNTLTEGGLQKPRCHIDSAAADSCKAAAHNCDGQRVESVHERRRQHGGVARDRD